MAKEKTRLLRGGLQKVAYGNKVGLDEITNGGLPKGRPTLVWRRRRVREDPSRHGVSCAGGNPV